jgi:hypothetical protein
MGGTARGSNLHCINGIRRIEGHLISAGTQRQELPLGTTASACFMNKNSWLCA